ncbi:MAG: 50S ribosomal protein L11 methyltransferase [Salinarimonadaceae bacterium]|nr:MAG: 50S ribosomal protein L11 methyltransferase [Salinarimonadaceae bacterium]
MLEGLQPARPTHLMRIETDERSARAMTMLLGEVFDAAETAVAAFEIHDDGPWLLEVYFSRAPNEDAIRELMRMVIGERAQDAVFDVIGEKDWVKASLEGLKPVRAGRFVVHGAHDRDDLRPGEIGVEIEAALAFGTGHHGTTRGCLLALDSELKRRRPRHVIDVGTGTGVLAFAAAKAMRRLVVAGDIDPVAVAIARDNARLNGLSPHLRLYVGAGVEHAVARRRRRFDLVFANILAKPLRRLAFSLAGVTADDGVLVLSGLLGKDVPGVLAAYRAQGFTLRQRCDLEGWAALTLARGGAARRPRR